MATILVIMINAGVVLGYVFGRVPSWVVVLVVIGSLMWLF